MNIFIINGNDFERSVDNALFEQWLEKWEKRDLHDHYNEIKMEGIPRVILFSDEWVSLQKFIVNESIERAINEP